MAPAKDGFINSWDRAQAHGKVWLSSSDVRWHLHAPKGRVFKAEDRDPKTSWGQRPGETKSFRSFTEATDWAKERYGVTGWKRDNMGGYHPSETASDVACDGGGLRACSNKRKPGETLCGVHLNSKRKDEERRVQWAEQSEKWKRDDQLSKDCREAAEALGIPVNKGRHVSMHAEDFLALCRELTELRELREML